MNQKYVALIVVAVCNLFTLDNSASAQGTAFTYQGQLESSGGPANGNYDFRFELFNNSGTNTGQIGSTQTNFDVGVTNGLFITTLDFGEKFPGADRWLAIGVRANGAGSFTAVSPSQPLTPAPYAITANNASNLLGNLPVAQLTGTVPLAQLPAAVVTTNDAASVSLTGAFAGNGANLAGIPLSGLASGGSLALVTNGAAFVFAGNFGVGNQPYFVIAATNLNGLGRVDLVTGNTDDNTLTVLTNNGVGGFGVEATPSVGNVPAAVAVGDVNNDGRPDIICANYNDGTLSVLTNTGSGFVSNATLTVGSQPIGLVAVRSLNGLGHVDLVSANVGTNTLTVLTNNGSGTFALKATITVGARPYSVVAADVTHAGRPDLICANSGTNTLTILINIGGGSFVPETYTVGNNPSCVVAADINGDGWADLVCANSGDGTVTVLTNNGTGDGSFTLASTFAAPAGVTTLAVADFNGDGLPDLVCADLDLGLQFALNTGGGTFVFDFILAIPGPDSEAQFNGLAAVDINGDGKPDVVTSDFGSNYVSVLVNAGETSSAELTAPDQGGGLTVSPGFLGVPNILGGSSSNTISPGVTGSVIAGGGSAAAFNQISASDSSISGGEGNGIQFAGDHSSIGGGLTNTINAEYAFIGAGRQNFAAGVASVIGAGQTNTASGSNSVVGGGLANYANADNAAIVGGVSNSVNGPSAFVGGGTQNNAPSPNSFVGAGLQNSAGGTGAVVAGGTQNAVNAPQATIGGGQSNNINGSGYYSTIAGGQQNVAASQHSTVGGGLLNQATATGSFVGGGGTDGVTNAGNIASGAASVIAGGLGNQNSGSYGTVGGGFFNTNNGGAFSTISGGYENLAGGLYTTVPGGYKNLAGGFYSFAAGSQAQAIHQGAFVWADSQSAVFQSTSNNQFNVRAGGGARFVTGGAGMTVDGALTAAGFNGNGGGLTSLAATNLTGTLPALNATNLTNLTAAKLTGPLPAISGASLTSLPASAALLNANQTFTGSNTFTNNLTVNTGAGTLQIVNETFVPGIIAANSGANSGEVRLRNYLQIFPNQAATQAGQIDVRNTGGTATIDLNGANGAIVCSNVTASGVLLTSDRNAKENFRPLDAAAILARVAALPLSQWNYKNEAGGARHIGPMAQDFQAAFQLSADDKHISVIDEGGVALAAIQGLNQKLAEKEAEIGKLKEKADKVDSLERQLHDLKQMVQMLAERK